MSGKETGYRFSKLVTVSGDKGIGPSKTNFVINLGMSVQCIKRVSIASVSFPNNAYNVNGTGGGANNTFSITANSITTLYTVPPGFYTTATLITAVQTAVQAYLTGLGNGQTFTLTQDSISQIVSATYNQGTSGVTFMTIQDAAGNSGVWELLGFIGSAAINLPSGTAVAATNLPSLGGLKEVYLQSAALAMGNMFDGTGQKNVLLTIPITAPFGISNVFECKVDNLCEITYMGPRTLQQVDFQLTDKNGNIVDLHGGNLNINLKFWFDRY
jgi:hypothetical protein